jgi:TolB protein
LTATDDRDGNLSWSPDGTRVAFDSTRDGNLELYVMPSACLQPETPCEPKRLTAYASLDQEPRWSPDGRWLVFESIRYEYRDIFVLDPSCLDDTVECIDTVRRLTVNSISDWAPVWSPHGDQIAFASNRGADWDLFIIDADCDTRPAGCETTARQLTDNAVDDTNPDWSPDGRYIIFESWLDDNWELFLIEADCFGCAAEQLTFNDYDDGEAVWWPG